MHWPDHIHITYFVVFLVFSLGETISEALWSEFETIALYEVYHKVKDTDAVVKLYNDLVY